MGGVSVIGSIKGQLSPFCSLSGTLSVPIGGIPEGSEMAKNEDIDNLIDDVFGSISESNPDAPTYDSDDIATDEELKDVLNDIFG